VEPGCVEKADIRSISGEVKQRGRTLKYILDLTNTNFNFALRQGDAFRFEPVTRKGECHSQLAAQDTT
jgi:hypothetical protein